MPSTSYLSAAPRSRHRTLLAVLAAATAAALLLPAQPALAAEPPSIEVSGTTGLDPSGGTVTVTGNDFTPADSLGTRPPLAGQPAGVYVAFGRFAPVWQPSQGAPSSSRQIIHQIWALPQAAHDLLNPTGTNPEIVLLSPDGSFSVELPFSRAEGTGSYGIAVYPGSGAVNPSQELLVPVSFGSPSTTTTVAPTTTTVPPTTTTVTPTTTVAPTSTVPAPGGSGSRSGVGPNGQRLTVAPAEELDPTGAAVRVTGSGYDPGVGVYVALCVDQGANAAPSPCVGGVDMEGAGSSSAWISSNPPSYAGDLTSPFGPGGTFDVALNVAAADEFVDCLDGATRCVLATRADHTASSNRSADVRVPVHFVGQTPPDTEPLEGQPLVGLAASTVTAGDPLTVTGSGFLAGEQVQIWLLSDPVLLSVATADGAGALSATVTIPSATPPGVHHIELRGLTSGRTVRSGALTVLGPVVTSAVADATTGGPPTGGGGATPGASLAFTGGGGVGLLAGGLLLLAGLALLTVSRPSTTAARKGAGR